MSGTVTPFDFTTNEAAQGNVVTFERDARRWVVEKSKTVSYKVGPNAGLRGRWVEVTEIVEKDGVLSIGQGENRGFVQAGLYDANQFSPSADALQNVGVWTDTTEASPFDGLTEEQRDAIEQAVSDQFDRMNMSDTILPNDMVTEMTRAAIDAYVKMLNA